MSHMCEPEQLAPQAARLLEHMRTISEQYGETLSTLDPVLVESLGRCATALSDYLGRDHAGQAETPVAKAATAPLPDVGSA